MTTAEMWSWSFEQGHEQEWAREQTVRFVDYWRGIPGQRGTKLNWAGTWRNWLRRSFDDHARGGKGRTKSESPDERFRRLMAQAEAMDTTPERLGVDA